MISPEMIGICEDIVGEAVGNLEPGYTYKGSVANPESLPAVGNVKGDLWQIKEDCSERVWDGTQWVARTALITPAQIDALWP